MIRERPGESNDREQVISSLDCDRFGRDLDKYRENFDKIDWGEKKEFKCGIPWGCWHIHGVVNPVTTWFPNYNLNMSPEEQRRQNIKNGYLKETDRVDIRDNI